MKLSSRQKIILYGLILGDGYLQKTGKKNARLRLEHSEKQREYLFWKVSNLKNLFNRKPTKMIRKHPNGIEYKYYRVQSNSSSFLGKLQQKFYRDGKKLIPEDINKYLKSPQTLALWYMDDGYYYERDKSAHLFLPKFKKTDLERLKKAFEANYGIICEYYCRPDRKSCQLNFTGKNLDKLYSIIDPYIIPSMKYKLPLDPVTTESRNNG